MVLVLRITTVTLNKKRSVLKVASKACGGGKEVLLSRT
jgi:hypothetical protein